MVREWDPRTASSTEIESLLESVNAAFAADLPEDPAWQCDHLREYLTETMPGERRIAWIAEGEPTVPGRPGRALGLVTVLLLADIGVVDLLVHPAARRQGLGRRLMARLTGHTGKDSAPMMTVARKIVGAVGMADVVLVRRGAGGIEPVAAGPFPLHAMAGADGFVLVPAESEGFPEGATVEMRPIP